MSIELILLVLTIGVILYVFNLSARKNHKLLKNFTGPPGIPLFGNALQIAQKGNAHMLEQLREWTGIYGGRYKIFLAFNPYIIISNAADAEKIMSSQVHIEKSDDYDFLKPWLGTGLLIAAGSYNIRIHPISLKRESLIFGEKTFKGPVGIHPIGYLNEDGFKREVFCALCARMKFW